MAAPSLQKMFGGVVPGGVITITPGTPIPVTANLELIEQRGHLLCRQIGFSVDVGAAGEVYVNYGNFPGKGAQTALLIQSGTTQTLPPYALVRESEIDATRWYLDGDAACEVAVSFADASNW